MSETKIKFSGPDLARGVPLSTVPDGTLLLGHAQGVPVLLARRGDELFAIGNVCTHYDAPLNEGLLVGDTVRCPWHHACFSLHTRWIAYSDSLPWRLQSLRYLHDCSNCFRPERFSRVGLSPTGKAPPLHGAHPNRPFKCVVTVWVAMEH